MKVIVWISRIFVGVLFIISGFIKANDPLGFSYKLQEYYEVFGQYPVINIFDNPIFHNTALEMSMFICIVEIVLGVALIIGAFPVVVSWVLLLMIVFFTFLTGFSAITGKVTDCGCFGDAVKLTPWESFYKDLVLLAFILVIFFYRKKIKPLFNRKTGAAIIGAATLVCLVFTIWAYMHLPFIDFRPYANENNICELMSIPPDAEQPEYATTLIYANKQTGEEREMTMDEYTESKIWEDENWEWKDTQSKLIKAGYEPKIKNFRVTNAESEDLTQALLDQPGYKFIVIAYNVSKADEKGFEDINRLQQQFEQQRTKGELSAQDFSFIGLSASGASDVDQFRHKVQAAYPFYTADETELKTIIRSNPGLLLLNGCEVVDKWHWRDVPEWEELQSKYFNK